MLAGALGERIRDRLREVPAPEGAADRLERVGAKRAWARAYLALAAAEADREIAARTARSGFDETRAARDSASCADPRRAGTIEAAWAAHADELAPARAERERLRDAAARRIERDDAAVLSGEGSETDPWEFLAWHERVAVVPLDDAVAAANRGVTDGSGDLRRAALGSHGESPAAPDLRRLLARLDGALDVRSDGCPPVGVAARSRPTASFEWSAGGPRVEIADWHGGPGGVRDALGAWGRAVRAGVIRTRRGSDAALTCDPAFGTAAETLFRRLVLSAEFARAAGLADRAAWIAAARREEAIASRVDWAIARTARVPIARLEGEAASALERACGRPTSAARRGFAWQRSVAPVDRLRGTILGLLVEEALCTRFGRAWFADRSAGRWLRDRWDEEPDATAESMAASIGTGRIEPTPVLDRCRP